jgi:negative regulator of sigma E activity
MEVSGRRVLVTVLGEVPVNTARRVADSLRWVDDASDAPAESSAPAE